MDYLLNNSKLVMLLLLAICFLLIIALFIQKINFLTKLKSERLDAVKRSKAVIGGQTVEQLAPYLPNFPCNPLDVRFIGKPIDFIGFCGLSEKDKIDEILFIEVKTGDSKLSQREKEIKNAVINGRVRYVEWKM